MVGFDPKKSHSRASNQQLMIAGAGSGFATRFICQPLDVIKIRFQLQVEPIKRTSHVSKYHNVIQACRSIVREEGLTSLWKGHVPAQLLSVTYGMIQFTSFELYTKYLWHFSGNERQSLNHFICGSMAGCSATLASQPFDIIRTRIVAQGEPKTYHSMVHAMSVIVKKDGLKGLYRGLLPTLIQIAPYSGSQFGFYYLTNKLWTDFSSSNTSSSSLSSYSSSGWQQTLTCGCVSGVAAKTLVYPLDFIKKRLEIQGFGEARSRYGKTNSYNGLVDCVLKVLKEESLLSFYKGYSPSLLKAALATALNFTFYEQFLNRLLKS